MFFTPGGDSYYLMDDYGHSIMGRDNFIFSIQACSDVHILLMKDRDVFDENVHEISIGMLFNV